VAALSYPFGVIPHRDGLQLAMALPTIQRGILDTPPSVMLAIDYLLQQSDLAHQGIELVGISFGAFLAAVPAAQDSRVTRLWLIHGSGDPQGVIAAGLEGRLAPAPLRELTAWLLATFAAAHHLSPELWVDRISPRPVMVVNARQDSALTEEAVAQLHNTLREPYEILWSPGDHVHPKRPETIEYITRLLFSRIGQQGQGSQ
jgi:surfactin synthase thioesterase subunit